ncbi:MAG: DUF4199 domain-containing protein [Bacteroidales bacterium]|jgi:hypothetical protein|nr:DUF4199 domain-containing protein [Bacteroidales bacterium]
MLRSGKPWWTIVLTGIFTGLVLFTVYFLLMVQNNQIVSWMFASIYLIPLIGMTYASIRVKNRYLGGYMKFSESFLISWLTGFLSAVVYSIFIYFIFTFLNSNELDYRALLLEQFLQMQSGSISIQEIHTMKSNISQLLSASYLALLNLIFHSVLATIYAFIIAIFVRRKISLIEV